MVHAPHHPRRTPRVRLLLLLAVLLTALTAAGCGADAESTSDVQAVEMEGGGAAADEAAPAPEEAADDSEGEAAGDSGGEAAGDAGSAEGAVLTGAGQGRQVITSRIDVAVDDVAAAARQVRDRAVAAGGYVSGESSVGGEQPRADITLRVPVGSTVDVMADVAALGEEVGRTTDSEVVETRLVDLESRTATQRAGVERVRALLAQAQDLDDVLALEAELTRRQADLDSVVAQREALADRAALATVTVVLTRPSDVELPSDPAPPFLEGLASGWEALAASTAVVLVVVGALLPFAVAALVVGGLVVLVLRATRSARAERTERARLRRQSGHEARLQAQAGPPQPTSAPHAPAQAPETERAQT